MNKSDSRHKKHTDEVTNIEGGGESETDESCTLCNGDAKTVSFKGQMVCEECLDYVREEY